ncbi:tRNA (adenosine(37)-N6)-dimethylallyltransferase MiaA [Spiroplasma tabanidicola]|uniref:tRNA dimethylallyltransferase n=1 Tax=Spiroplasma tabanidicola TaxID=324079 RepID=A0A6I6C8R8_9MOLU|nr:tRNA (adenosine(37)-N6)-dimethylallyltransferase MiaA [Spiroplasma tabanidicola]QGS51859.1 tRNA dimethylallyltransferase [Spiroplasma tabanidicola]
MSSTIIVIVGPTASGKTDLSIKLAKEFNGECINADATQIFCGTDIATNKITTEEMQGIKHHLLSTKKVNETYSVADFQKDGRKAIEKILKNNKTPIIIGGTGLYINALLRKYNFKSDDHIPGFNKKFDNLDNNQLWEILNQKDSISASQIHPNNRYRIIRALEIYELNGIKKSDLIVDNKEFYYDKILFIGINPDRSLLHSKINSRVLKLVDMGLFEEIEKAWIDNDKNKNAQALKCIGGPEIIGYLNKEYDYQTAISLMQRNNRRYARRQITWFKNQLKETNWFTHNYKNFELMCLDIVNFVKKRI